MELTNFTGAAGLRRIAWGLALAGAAWLAAGCDEQRLRELEEGVSTEADVRAKFGQPENVWDEPGGARTFEYNRQPEGTQNYMITIGADGKMSALRQVLAPHNFAKIVPGMPMETVRRMLGKPMKTMTFALKKETAWDWRYTEPPNSPMIFTVYFDSDMHVLRSGSAMELRDGR